MPDTTALRPDGKPRGRPFAKGKSGNPKGRRPGCLNKASLAAAALLDGEVGRPTRRAVELAAEGEPVALTRILGA